MARGNRNHDAPAEDSAGSPCAPESNYAPPLEGEPVADPIAQELEALGAADPGPLPPEEETTAPTAPPDPPRPDAPFPWEVVSPIRKDGQEYAPGSPISLTAAEAAAMPWAVRPFQAKEGK